MPQTHKQKKTNRPGIYQQIYAAVHQIPFGKVATYGQIADRVDGATARMVGYAMAALPKDSDVPWQRVINRKGEVSPRKSGMGRLYPAKAVDV